MEVTWNRPLDHPENWTPAPFTMVIDGQPAVPDLIEAVGTHTARFTRTGLSNPTTGELHFAGEVSTIKDVYGWMIPAFDISSS